MTRQHEESNERRFEIEKLEERVAPIIVIGGLPSGDRFVPTDSALGGLQEAARRGAPFNASPAG